MEPVWFIIWTVGCHYLRRKKKTNLKKSKIKKNTSRRNFSHFFLCAAPSLFYHPRNISCVVVSFVLKFYNSRALKCMLLFDICLNYSTRWIINWSRYACAVHKMLGISHKILVCVCCSYVGVLVFAWFCTLWMKFKRVKLCSCPNNHTNTYHTKSYGASRIRAVRCSLFFSLQKLNLDLYIWAIAYWRLHWLLKKELFCVCMREGCAVRAKFANLTETIRRN